MSERRPPSTRTVPGLPEHVVQILRDKDRIVRVQAKRIEMLENEVDKLRKERDSLSTKVTLLSYKLQMNSQQTLAQQQQQQQPIPPAVSDGAVNRVASPPPLSSAGHRDTSGAVGGKVIPIQGSVGQVVNGGYSPNGSIRPRTSSGSSLRSQQRQRQYKRGGEEEDAVKRSRAWANAYELSQDLHDKQLQMLERKYGGHLRARHAARVIQQAYRKYCMNRNFMKLRSEAEERRLSRRLSEFGRSKTIWTDMVASIEEKANLHSRFYTTDHVVTSCSDQEFAACRDQFDRRVVMTPGARLCQTHSTATSMTHTVKVIKKSHSLNTVTQKDILNANIQKKPLQRTVGLDLGTITENSKVFNNSSSNSNVKAKPQQMPPHPLARGEESNNNRNSYPELNDSSESGSPQDTPVEPTVDLPSVNFENLLESKETDILNDSFHSDSSQDAVHSPRTTRPHTGRIQSYDLLMDNYLSEPTTPTIECLCLSPALDNSSLDHTLHGSDLEISQRTFVNSDVKIHVDDSELPEGAARAVSSGSGCVSPVESCNSVTPTDEYYDSGTLTKMYGNTIVTLRKKKPQTGDSPVSSGSDTTPTEQQPVPAITMNGSAVQKKSPEVSPIWKRKSAQLGSDSTLGEDIKRMSNISEASEPESLEGRESREGFSSSPSSDTCSMGSEGLPTYHTSLPSSIRDSPQTHAVPKLSDRQRKRLYRIGLNLFNKKPEKGIKYLVENRFLENRPLAVAKFLISRKGLSKQMIGEYLGNLQKQFNMEVLNIFSCEIDLAGLQVDMALRTFQSHFRMPGEAQKIERLMEAFAERYCDCNPDQLKQFLNPDSVFLLAFAIIMLNTDLHNKNIKAERKMKLNNFVKNLKGIDGGSDIDRDLLAGIYERIKVHELKPGTDHVSQVLKVENMINGKAPQLALPHRRLVCYCRLYEVLDPNKREKLGLHQREVFLFNDLLMVTKIFSKKKNNVTYSYRDSFTLCGMLVYLFETPHYKYGIRLTTNIDGKILFTFNARNEHDRSKFVEDLREAIHEMNEMETLRIEDELSKQKMPQNQRSFNRHSKDSGVVDIELLKPTDPGVNRLSAPECGGLKKNTLSNSLIDLNEATLRRGSGGSLDSGMASTGSGSQGSQEDNSKAAIATTPAPTTAPRNLRPSQSAPRFSLFSKKPKGSRSSVLADSSEV